MFSLAQLEHPVVQAPLGGGPSTPELAAAVTEAGGLGFLAAGYKTAEGVRADVERVRSLTARPFRSPGADGQTRFGMSCWTTAALVVPKAFG